MGREFFICEDAAFVTPVCPRLVIGNAVPAHLVKYCMHLSGIGRFDKVLLCPHEDGQEQRLSSASIKFLWLSIKFQWLSFWALMKHHVLFLIQAKLELAKYHHFSVAIYFRAKSSQTCGKSRETLKF